MTSQAIQDPLADHLITPHRRDLHPLPGDQQKCGVLPTVPELAELVQDDAPIDRMTLDSWEDIEFVGAVRATGRRELIFWALSTKICRAFAALDALRDGYEVYPVGAPA